MNANGAIDLSRVAVILTTWNSERCIDSFSGPLLEQEILPEQVLVVDSESKDHTVERVRSSGFRVHEIPGVNSTMEARGRWPRCWYRGGTSRLRDAGRHHGLARYSDDTGQGH
jgi:glycosyltransferase involved in cell wall biosynthesis